MFLIFSFQYQKILKLCNPYLGNFRNQIVTQLSHVMCSNLLNQFQQSVKFCCNMVWLNFHFGWVKVHGSILSHLNHHSLLWLPTILYWKEDICNLKMVCLKKKKKKKKQKQLIYLMKDEESLKYQRCRQSKNKWAYPQSWPNSYGVVVISKILFFV